MDVFLCSMSNLSLFAESSHTLFPSQHVAGQNKEKTVLLCYGASEVKCLCSDVSVRTTLCSQDTGTRYNTDSSTTQDTLAVRNEYIHQFDLRLCVPDYKLPASSLTAHATTKLKRM